MDSRKRSHWQIDEEDESIVEEDCPSASQVYAQIEGSGPPDHSEETTPPADLPQEALRDVYGDLTDKLYSPSLVEHLYAARILTDVEYETINSRGSNHDKNTEVLAAMRRRSQNEVLQFCQLLFTYNQHNCGRIMLAALRRRGVDVSSITVPSPNPPAIKSSSPTYYPEMTALKKSFINLVREVRKVGETVEDLKTVCIELLNEVNSTKRNTQEDINELRKCSDQDCILYLQPYWDSLDCDLLYNLILLLEKPELTRDWEKYRTQVKDSCRATLAECRRNLPQGRELSANQISAGFQTDQSPNDVTVQKILDLKDFLKKMMGLEEADFEGFANSDVTLFYTVGRIRLPFLVRLCALHRRSLQEFSVTVVFVPGEFMYDVITDQEFPYPKVTSHSEQLLQVKDLKEEVLHQFEELIEKKSKVVGEDVVRSDHLQNQVIALQLKLKEEEIMRKKSAEDYRRMAGELVKLQSKQEELQAEKKELQTEKKELQTEKKELQTERNQLTLKNEELNEKLISVQESIMTKKESVMSGVSLEKRKSEIQSLLELQPSSVEGLQDKLKLLLEEWSKEEESLQQGTFMTEENYTELIKAQFETVQSKMRGMFDDLVKKLGCKENETLMIELRKMFFFEVRPLRESFRKVYSKVFTPQIEKNDKEASELCKELFDESPDRVFQSDEMNNSSLHSVKMADLPIPTTHATAVLIGRNVYLAGGVAPDVRSSWIVQVYNIDAGKWSTLPPAPQYNSEAIAINNNLVLIGGMESSTGKTTNMVSTWLVEEEKWTQTIPPMSTRRAGPGVLLLKNYLFVFGGEAEDDKTLLDSFEVLNVKENQWSSGRGLLPRSLCTFKLGVFGDAVILTSAWTGKTTPTTKSWKIPVRVLEDSVTNSSSQPIQWTPIADTPYFGSSLLTNSKQPILVGGHSKEGQPTKAIHLYTLDHWEVVGQLSEPRMGPAVITISDNSFLVFGGCTDPLNFLQSLLNSVELIRM